MILYTIEAAKAGFIIRIYIHNKDVLLLPKSIQFILLVTRRPVMDTCDGHQLVRLPSIYYEFGENKEPRVHGILTNTTSLIRYIKRHVKKSAKSTCGASNPNLVTNRCVRASSRANDLPWPKLCWCESNMEMCQDMCSPFHLLHKFVCLIKKVWLSLETCRYGINNHKAPMRPLGKKYHNMGINGGRK